MHFNYLELAKKGEVAKHYNIPRPAEGRRLVIGDIHGCARTFRMLLSKIELSRKDQLFLLGDYINRGPDSMGVLDYILELLSRGYQIFPIRGNHEQMAIDSHGQPVGNTSSFNHGKGILEKNDGIRYIMPKYYAFITQLPYYYESDGYYLVHAGFDFNTKSPFEEFEQMPWLRPFFATTLQTKGKQIIIGHDPETLPNIKQRIFYRETVIKLDNGCVYSSRPLMAHLLCFNMDTHELTAQPNVDFAK